MLPNTSGRQQFRKRNWSMSIYTGASSCVDKPHQVSYLQNTESGKDSSANFMNWYCPSWIAVYLACMVNFDVMASQAVCSQNNICARSFMSSVCTDIQLKYLPIGRTNTPSYSIFLCKGLLTGSGAWQSLIATDMYILYAMICIDIDIYSVEQCAVPSHVTPASWKWLQLA